ncbi:MAG: shikimate kinase [Bacillota bacterium]|nr:shikimate kinase [Bacillota bacterium]
MSNKLTIVTGYFGAPVLQLAEEIAAEENCPLIDLDREIEKRDGRSIKRLVMMNGEHGYRNNEYEVLAELAKADKALVLACGDGVLHDEDSRAIIAEGRLIIAGEDMSPDALWENARMQTDTYHAFMSFGTDEDKRKAFDSLLERQKKLFGGKL